MISVNRQLFEGQVWHAQNAPDGTDGLKNGQGLPINEQQVNELTAALKVLTTSQLKQAEAINRLALVDEALISLIIETLVDEIDDELPPQTYLDGKSR